MDLHQSLLSRSDQKCELCDSANALEAFEVTSSPEAGVEAHVLTCQECRDWLSNPDLSATDRWTVLGDSMWSEHAPVQVLSWRVLDCLKSNSWAQDLLDMLYLDEERSAWSAADPIASEQSGGTHRDSNGAVLVAGDTVTLIKDLTVKGAGFTAKRGTAVRNISLVQDTPEHIEGRVSGQQIVILTKFVKK
jgi:protein PhnA